ncbi:hypothetical protein VT84_36900 [Gemmata sp. SH-PL17]|uniref:hypothetical protein n=1 Tax=Gemmata sp. SH-PL17 TaxID=1630693 RepID=UPI00078C381E|nr:hypothetical protein [Gemmata sp. SH-PL17]AMV29265.1 hypothetical protein VT84_33025 [Gemmata sp. SH-PL17]AMV30031.1 hypothetical protein VT84_36900 [Gemmata sp. SH-PL17]
MVAMAKKKPKGGKHTTNRKPMLLPEAWDAIAQELATAAGQPKMWKVVELLKREAEAKGMTNLPRPPWVKEKPEEEGDEKPKK